MADESSLDGYPESPARHIWSIVRAARSLATALRKTQPALSEASDPYLKSSLAMEIGQPASNLNFFLSRDVESGSHLTGIDLTQMIYTLYKGRNALRSAMLQLVTLFYDVFHVRVQDVTRGLSSFSEDELKALEAATDELELAASKIDDGGPRDSSSTAPATPKKPKRRTDPAEDRSDEQAAVRLLGVFTNGIADERFGTAASVLQDANLTVNEKLTKIDGLIPFPPTASAKILGQLVGGVSKQAVMKTEWWIKNRKGEKENEIGRRHNKHRERATQHERNRTNDGDE